MSEDEKRETKRAVVGDAVEVPKGQTMMVRPDGVVVTCRRSYVVDMPGKHVCGPLVINVRAKKS